MVTCLALSLFRPEGAVGGTLHGHGIPPGLRPGGTFDTRVRRLAVQHRFSGALLVARGDQVILQRAYGLADIQRRRPNRVNTKFNLGSACKMFTAVAIAQLVEKGRLRLTDPIGRYVHGFPSTIADHVTVRQLLTHTSGMGDFFQDPQYHPRTMQTVAQLLGVIKREPLRFTPGARFFYSNSGYVVLGALVEAVTGQDYYTYVRVHIFELAGMHASGFYRRGQAVPNLALGYTRMNDNGRITSGPPKDNVDSLPLRGSPAGGGYSTIVDLFKFSQALRRHRLLNPTDTAMVMMGKVQMTGPDGAVIPHETYGFGFGNLMFDGERIVGHNGGAPGIAANLDMLPAHGYTAVILANQDPGPDFQSVVGLERENITKAIR